MIRKTLIVFIGLWLAGCSALKPQLSQDVRDRLDKLLQDGSTLTAQTAQGVNFADFSQQLALTEGDYSLASAVWPKDFSPEIQTSFNRAFEGWDLAHYLWNAKIQQLDPPTEPNVNKYSEIVGYAGESNLIVQVWGPYAIPAEYSNKKYLPLDENISALLSVAGNYYRTAQAALLAAMKQ